MRCNLMLLRLTLGITVSFCVFGSDEGKDRAQTMMVAIDDAKLKSSGSYLLTKKDNELYVVLGQRNKPGKNEDKTLSSFHGNIIRKDGIYDRNALEASKRNLAWEFLLVEGDPKNFSPTSLAKQFLDTLEPVGMLKNRNWSEQQRPNFIYVVSYESIKNDLENFEGKVLRKAETSKWPPELTSLKLIKASELIEEIEKQIQEDNDEKDLITYGKFTKCNGHKIYDACSRTIAASLNEFKRIVQEYAGNEF